MVAKIMPFAFLFLLAAGPTTKPVPLPPLNARIVAFCQKHMGESVGSGQCAGLAEHAVVFAGARIWPKMTPAGSNDYVWGRLIATVTTDTHDLQKALPGDIIQMRGVKFSDGGGAEHHTAIVKEVVDGNIVVFEQNRAPELVVIEYVYRIGDMTAGWMKVYRPIR